MKVIKISLAVGLLKNQGSMTETHMAQRAISLQQVPMYGDTVTPWSDYGQFS